MQNVSFFQMGILVKEWKNERMKEWKNERMKEGKGKDIKILKSDTKIENNIKKIVRACVYEKKIVPLHRIYKYQPKRSKEDHVWLKAN